MKGTLEREIVMEKEHMEKGMRRNQRVSLIWLLLLISSLCVMLIGCIATPQESKESGSDAVVQQGKVPTGVLEPVTLTPEPTEEPEATLTPEPTEEPKATLTPEPTEEPEATLTPEPTKEPEATLTPEPTKEPEATLTPEPTEEPEATLTPEPTEEPEATLTPEPTEEPEATLTPEPTEEPEATPTPEPTVEPVEQVAWTNIPERVANGEIDPSLPMVALTFDDGPYTKVTTRILDVLAEYGGRATFFVVGERLSTYSDTLKRAYEEGHQIASHTWSHPDLSTLSAKKIQKELSRTEEKLNEYIPVGTVMLRPPYGSAKKIVKETVAVPMINWSVDSRDWESRNADKIVKKVLKEVDDGDIVLMHDLYTTTAAAVEELVPKLVEQGYQLVTVEELFVARGQELMGGKVHYSVPAAPKN